MATDQSQENHGLQSRFLAIAALVVAALGLGITVFGINSVSLTCSSGASGSQGASGVAGLSAYGLWLKLGNKGDEQAFLDSLVGDRGSTGLTGISGKSAYELWLAAGHKGTKSDFLASLVGNDGVDGLSAYELWLLQGNTGSEQQFLASLVGEKGETGSTGSNGSNGATGPTGATGQSAYEVWVANGHTGQTVEAFLAALKGDPGVCTVATAGPGTNANFYGAFYDDQTQPNPVANVQHAMRYNQSTPGVNGVFANGVRIVDGTKITFDHAGIYNIQFSAQMEKSTGGSDPVDIWLSYKGTRVPTSDTQFQLGTTKRYVAAWNFFVNATAGDYYEIMWISPDITQDILATPERTVNGVTIPAIPSLILTVNQVGN